MATIRQQDLARVGSDRRSRRGDPNAPARARGPNAPARARGPNAPARARGRPPDPCPRPYRPNRTRSSDEYGRGQASPLRCLRTCDPSV